MYNRSNFVLEESVDDKMHPHTGMEKKSLPHTDTKLLQTNPCVDYIHNSSILSSFKSPHELQPPHAGTEKEASQHIERNLYADKILRSSNCSSVSSVDGLRSPHACPDIGILQHTGLNVQ